jgi:acylphosphatase
MPIPELSRVSLRIQGRVQGVFFRESARQEATRLGLTGWVKNLSSGDVELLAEGPRDQLESFVGWCRHGPPTAKVSDVMAAYSMGTGEFERFAVERTR